MVVPHTEIVAIRDGAEILRKTVAPGSYVIGREEGCDLRLDVELISRRHALLTVAYDHALIEDLESSNGTFVNGQRVTESTRLWPNQKIQVGAATLELRRLKTDSISEEGLAPSTAAVRKILPEEFLREKKYDIGGVVAQGGMGAILQATDATTERTVAMKVMLDGSSPDSLVRFVSEAKVTAQLEHPSIVPIYELGVDENDQVFYTMKFVRGITLKKVLELMAAGTTATLAKYSLGPLLTLFQKVCDALAFAHSKGVIHRDLKPENIMLGDFGEVLVMDWGLAKLQGQDEERAASGIGNPIIRTLPSESAGATMVGSIMGTPQYMAPEQARGEIETMDARADIYALGAILYHLLALQEPVTGENASEVVAKVARGATEPLNLARKYAHLPGGRIPDSLAAVVRKAMAFAPAARYASVPDLQRDIEAYQAGFATSAEKAGAWKQLTLFVKRNKAASIGVAAVLMVGATLGTKAVIEGRRAEREAAAAKATLADLRRTAPVFYDQAKVVFAEGQFEDAIEKIGYAIQLDETEADYRLFRAHLRESSQQLAEAEEDYRQVLALRPEDEAAKTNIALCEKLLQESGGQPLNRKQQTELLSALRAQKRLVESAPLAMLIDPDLAATKAAILARLREARKQPGWDDHNVNALPDGTFSVNLTAFALGDLSLLKGLPITELILNATGITDLSVLTGLPLTDLRLRTDKVSDLTPLRGMKLRKLDLYQSDVSDLSPLAGMPLAELGLEGCKAVGDLSPLRGMALVVLRLDRTDVGSLAPVAGAPLKHLGVRCSKLSDLTPLAAFSELEELTIDNLATDLTPLAKLHLTHLDCSAAKITNIAALRGQPLHWLSLEKTNVTDLSPLADCTTLEEIVVPMKAKDLSMLRKLPNLRAISIRSARGHPIQSAEEFWKQYDTNTKGGAK